MSEQQQPRFYLKKILLVSAAALLTVGAVTYGIADARSHGHGGCGHGPKHAMEGERHGSGKGMMHKFEEMDLNKDGSLSQEEIKAAQEKRFAAMDANQDGQVNAEELAAYRMKQRANRWVARHDTNDDGQISLDEMPDFSEKMMRFDLDENGVITKTELEAAKMKHRHSGRGHGPRGDKAGQE